MTNKSEEPLAEDEPYAAITPPFTKLGSSPSSVKAVIIIPVLVVLPCAPATEINFLPLVRYLSACDLWRIGKPFFWAKTYSGLVGQRALVTTTVSQSPRFFSSCPIAITAPSFLNSMMFADSLTSLPVIAWPAFISILAIPLIPDPPIPMKCTFPRFAGIGWLRSGLMVMSSLIDLFKD